jgi:hypothetical protein
MATSIYITISNARIVWIWPVTNPRFKTDFLIIFSFYKFGNENQNINSTVDIYSMYPLPSWRPEATAQGWEKT